MVGHALLICVLGVNGVAALDGFATDLSAARGAAGRSRHIPAAVKREVWKRDGGQCAFVGTQGRCTERGFLEFHHVEPYAVGGQAVVENVELRCKPHNLHEAEKRLGDRLPLLVREAPPLVYGGFELGPDRVRTSASCIRRSASRQRCRPESRTMCGPPASWSGFSIWWSKKPHEPQ